MPGQNASPLDGRIEAACGLLAELGACGLPWASFSRSRAFRRVLIFLPPVPALALWLNLVFEEQWKVIFLRSPAGP